MGTRTLGPEEFLLGEADAVETSLYVDVVPGSYEPSPERRNAQRRMMEESIGRCSTERNDVVKVGGLFSKFFRKIGVVQEGRPRGTSPTTGRKMVDWRDTNAQMINYGRISQIRKHRKTFLRT